MTEMRRVLWPLAAFIGGSLLLTSVYFGIVSWAESFDHARDLFREERRIVLPLILGFGVQAALYIILKKRLFVPVPRTGPAGAFTGAGGATSGLAMVACCAHHVADVLPILGLTAAAAFLAEARDLFLWVGLGTTLIGIAAMLFILFRERSRAVARLAAGLETT